MDEGWTRFVLEQYGFEPKTLENKTARAGNLAPTFDVIVLPDLTKEVIATGKPKRDEGAMRYFPEMPPEYAGGLDKEGAAALKAFVEAGGTLVALASASEYAIEELSLPVRNALGRTSDFAISGSLLRAEVAPGHPVTYGLPHEVAVFQDDPLAFDTVPPGPEIERWVLATYPAAPQDVLLSGWLRGPEAIVRKAAVVALTYGKGRVVLVGFRAQHRAQTPGTFASQVGAHEMFKAARVRASVAMLCANCDDEGSTHARHWERCMRYIRRRIHSYGWLVRGA